MASNSAWALILGDDACLRQEWS